MPYVQKKFREDLGYILLQSIEFDLEFESPRFSDELFLGESAIQSKFSMNCYTDYSFFAA